MQITGGVPLEGVVRVSGSKNAALPTMAAALLSADPVELTNVPDIDDIPVMTEILSLLGASVTSKGRAGLQIVAKELDSRPIPEELTRRIRGSFLLFGALVGRTGHAHIAKPGGDDIGMRRVEQHLEGLRHMGAHVEDTGDAYVAHAPHGLHGARIDLDMPTVTGTENLMMAAALAEGVTVITNAAREPHVVNLAECICSMGCRVSGAGTGVIFIDGVGGRGGRKTLHGTIHPVTSDYIEAGTYMMAAAATGGDVTCAGISPPDVYSLSNKLRASGCEVTEGTSHVRVKGKVSRAVDATTWPHPGFATDLQSQYVALMTQAEGLCMVSEAVFENRFRHVEELRRMGADVRIEGRSVVVSGPSHLVGTRVEISDIRSGAALVIAAMCAEGTTSLTQIQHLDRGYEDLDQKLVALGARLARVCEPALVGSGTEPGGSESATGGGPGSVPPVSGYE